MRINGRLFVNIIALFLPVLLLAECKNANMPGEYKPSYIRVKPETLTIVEGDVQYVKASVVPSVANQPEYQWFSEDTAVATVDNGQVTAVAPGKTNVTVSALGVSASIEVTVQTPGETTPKAMYEKKFTGGTAAPELTLNGVAELTDNGVYVTSTEAVVQHNLFYALAERMVRYRVVFSADARAVFRSSQGDFSAYVDIQGKEISIATSPVTKKSVDFLQPDREYDVEIYHIYQQAKVRVVDLLTGEEAEISAVHDGEGGVGQGVVNEDGFSVGMQWDHYCFGLAAGSSMTVSQMAVYAMKERVKLLIYGDSISQPEGYYPKKDFPLSWTQLVIAHLKGDAMSSGRGGGNINTLLEYIKNELPYISAKYVMVTIGTNGGNTAENLSELVDYIKSQGSIPILNNIPCNESASQIEINGVIAGVRGKYGIKGCMFDLVTSVDGDGREVDKSTMYWENYTNGWGNIYHHPNEKGGKKMFDRTLVDVPEIYE